MITTPNSDRDLFVWWLQQVYTSLFQGTVLKPKHLRIGTSIVRVFNGHFAYRDPMESHPFCLV